MAPPFPDELEQFAHEAQSHDTNSAHPGARFNLFRNDSRLLRGGYWQQISVDE
jgi:hypothetical protein